MDTQKAYENIRAHFSGFNAKLAYNESLGVCQYLTPEGNKCAVGALIPDTMYRDGMECKGVAQLRQEFPVVDGFLWNVDTKFLEDAQKLHDSVAKDALAFVRGLDIIARLHGLTVPALYS